VEYFEVTCEFLEKLLERSTCKRLEETVVREP
jgi:hypothetical protein